MSEKYRDREIPVQVVEVVPFARLLWLPITVL